MGNNNPDIVIIGAGCAGAYAAWRLSQQDQYKGQDIRVYELLPRVGGRLVSKWMSEVTSDGPCSPDEQAKLGQFQYIRKSEFGGMRYLTNQYLVSYLLMDWQRTKNWTTVPFAVNSESDIYNLRGKWMSAADLVDPGKRPYTLQYNEQAMSPAGIFLYALNTVLPNAAYMSPDELSHARQTFTYKGVPLYKLGFWNVVRDIVSQEAYEFAINGFGYNTTSNNWNMADAIPWYLADFPADVQYRYLHRGYDELPKQLMIDAQAQDVTLYLKHALVRLEDAGDEWQLQIVDIDKHEKHEITTKKVLLAMPRTSLEALKLPFSIKTSKWHTENVRSVTPQPMFKFFLGYPYPWFRTIGLTNGRTVTDSPVRQIYYWGTASDQFFTRDDLLKLGIEDPPPPPNPNDTYNPAVLMVYTDGRNVDFWNPLFEQVHSVHDQTYASNVDPGAQQKLAQVYDSMSHLFPGFEQMGSWSPEQLANRSGRISLVQDVTAEEKYLIDVIQKEIRHIHDLDYVPEPIVFGYADWSQYPFGGAWNSWNPGYKSWEVVKNIQALYQAAGNDEKNIHVIGEAYSQDQGWVEGAFVTAEQVLHDHFGLSKPHWIPEKAYQDVLKVT